MEKKFVYSVRYSDPDGNYVVFEGLHLSERDARDAVTALGGDGEMALVCDIERESVSWEGFSILRLLADFY